MEVYLPNDAARFIEGLVASGEYETTDEAVAEGVRLLMARKQLRADIQKGIDELDAGHGIQGDKLFTELRERSRNLAQ